MKTVWSGGCESHLALVAVVCVLLTGQAFAQSFRRAGTEFNAVRQVTVPAGKAYSVVVVEFLHHGEIHARRRQRPGGRAEQRSGPPAHSASRAGRLLPAGVPDDPRPVGVRDFLRRRPARREPPAVDLPRRPAAGDAAVPPLRFLEPRQRAGRLQGRRADRRRLRRGRLPRLQSLQPEAGAVLEPLRRLHGPGEGRALTALSRPARIAASC